MTNTIRNADKDFDFSKIHLGNPHSLQGGSYFSKILFGPTDETVYIQTPKCKCNKGIIRTGKKEYIVPNNKPVDVNVNWRLSLSKMPFIDLNFSIVC